MHDAFMHWKCKEHIVARLNHQQRQKKKKSNFLLQKFKSATCRTNLEVPQTGKKKKKKAINWNLTINESFGFWFLLLSFPKISIFLPFILQISFFTIEGGKSTWPLICWGLLFLFASYLLCQLHYLNFKNFSLWIDAKGFELHHFPKCGPHNPGSTIY